MKRMTYFVMALALVLGFTQCKKEQVNTPENETKTVNISLKVGGHGGSRHTINTENGDVDFEDGDVIYVGDGTTYIGTLTRTDGVFSGSINEPADGTEIYFYFVGGLTPSATPEAGTTSSFTVDISNQSTKMPVLSCNHVTYSSGTASYSCVLQNQCALVKFTTASTTDPVHVGGLYTEAMIDFDNNSITNNGTTGFVNLHPDAEDNEAKWAVLLPQTSFSGIEGVVADKGYTMQTQTTILADGFITGDDFSISSTPSHNRYLQWAIGDLTLEDGDQVYGTLGGQYRVSIAAGATTNGVTLNGVTIDRSGLNYPGIKCLGNATITLKDGTANTVKGFNQGYPGIYVPEGSTLIIQGETTPGTGSLDAFGRGTGGAGIGGGKNSSCGNITISGGIVTAEGGERAAGIGGGKGIDGQHKTKCGTITITSGVTSVEATRVSSASAYIGAGWSCTCGKVTIDDVENATTSSTFEHFNSTINGNTWTLMHK